MRVITAPMKYVRMEGDVTCFLAGGICNCPNWQNEVIEHLRIANPENLVVFNPRRENFPIHDPSASKEQITWEFNMLERADIFSMYFCSGESDQPICMYELGRHMHRIYIQYPYIEITKHLQITVEDGYRRKQDVLIQTGLALLRDPDDTFVNTGKLANPVSHARDILVKYAECKAKDSDELGKLFDQLNESGAMYD